MRPPFDPPDETWDERLRRQLAERQRRIDARAAERAEMARRRDYGLRQRHATKLRHLANQNPEEEPVITKVSHKPDPELVGPSRRDRTDRVICCRYRRRNDEMCTGEAIDADAHILICAKHAARVMKLIQERIADQEETKP